MPNAHPFHLVATESGGESLTVYPLGSSPIAANSDHPHFADILGGARSGLDVSALVELADLSAAVSARLTPLSDRVSVSGGTVLFDADPIASILTDHIVRALDSGSTEWANLVRFLEKLATNPQQQSRDGLYAWLDATGGFTIAASGDFVGFKGVALDSDGEPVSVRSGSAIVDGQPVRGQIPNSVGSVITMPRSAVAFNPAEPCSAGLHIGTRTYAQSWASGALLRVSVSPRDVVSVPADSNAEKVRVCRYRVMEVIDAPETLGTPEPFADYGDDFDEYDESEEW